MCSTMSSADLGANRYRAADGTAVLGTLAEDHDKIFNRVMGTIRGIARAFLNLLLTTENPSTGVFWMQPQVKAALAKNMAGSCLAPTIARLLIWSSTKMLCSLRSPPTFLCVACRQEHPCRSATTIATLDCQVGIRIDIKRLCASITGQHQVKHA